MDSLINIDDNTLQLLADKLQIPKENAKNILLFNRNEMLYCANTGIMIDRVNADESNNLKYYITVPDNSEIKDNETKEKLCDSVLAERFKEFIYNGMTKIIDDGSISESNISVLYITREDTWNLDKKTEALNMIRDKIKENPAYPFEL